MVDRIVTYMGASFPFFSGSAPQLIMSFMRHSTQGIHQHLALIDVVKWEWRDKLIKSKRLFSWSKVIFGAKMHNSYKIDSAKQILDQNQVRKYQKINRYMYKYQPLHYIGQLVWDEEGKYPWIRIINSHIWGSDWWFPPPRVGWLPAHSGPSTNISWWQRSEIFLRVAKIFLFVARQIFFNGSDMQKLR